MRYPHDGEIDAMGASKGVKDLHSWTPSCAHERRWETTGTHERIGNNRSEPISVEEQECNRSVDSFIVLWHGYNLQFGLGHTAWELRIRSIGFGRQDVDCLHNKGSKATASEFFVRWRHRWILWEDNTIC